MNSDFLLPYLPVVVLAIVFLAMFWGRNFWIAYRLQKIGLLDSAKVLKFGTARRRLGQTQYAISYQYGAFIHREPLTEAQYSRLKARREVKIRYMPGNPQVTRLVPDQE